VVYQYTGAYRKDIVLTERQGVREVVDRGMVYPGGSSGERQSCCFPGVCVLPGGRWVVSFRAAPTKEGMHDQHLLITWSDDEGQSWSEPIEPFAPMKIGDKTGVFRGGFMTAMGGESVLAALYWVDYSNPDLPFFNEETGGLLDSRICFSRSEDGGATWSHPDLMDTSPFQIPTPVTGPVLRLANGDLACHFETHKHHGDTAEGRPAAIMMFSSDGGKTWPRHSIIGQCPENRIVYWDQRPSVLANGDLLDVFWTYDNYKHCYLTMRAKRSTDNGATWSQDLDTGIPGQPATVISTHSGEHAFVYVDRTGSPAIKMRLSRDGGDSWPESTEISLHQSDLSSQIRDKNSLQDTWTELEQYSLGLPQTALLASGCILVVYYAGSSNELTSILWAVVKV